MTDVFMDSSKQGFFDGREFRSFFEFNIATGTTTVMRYTANVDFILKLQDLTVDDGSIKFSAIANGTTGGVWTALPIIGKNRMLSNPQPAYVAKNTFDQGGTVTGGTVVEIFRVVASSVTAQKSTVSGRVTERALPAGVYHLKLENISTGSATGVYSLEFEERPLGTSRG